MLTAKIRTTTISFVAAFSLAGASMAPAVAQAKPAIKSPAHLHGASAIRSAKKKHRKKGTPVKGLPGPTGPRGIQGSKGDTGATGPAGAYPKVLPSGQSLQGAFANIGRAPSFGRIGSAISFAIPLASPPIGHFIPVGGVAPAACPGTAAEPKAAPGHLCIYEGVASNVTFESFEDPVTGGTGSTTRTFGEEVVGFSAAAGDYDSSGSWAVTAR